MSETFPMPLEAGDFGAADFLCEGMKFFYAFAKIFQLGFRDAVASFVARPDIGFHKQFEDAPFFLCLLRKYLFELKFVCARPFPKLFQIVAFRFVARKCQEDCMVGMLGGLMKMKGCYLALPKSIEKLFAVLNQTVKSSFALSKYSSRLSLRLRASL